MASYYRKVLTMKSSPWQTACIAAATLTLFAVLPLALPAQNDSNLQHRIAAIATQAHGKVSVACALPMSSSPSSLNCDLHPDAHPPMQSVFKLPLALAVLHQVEQGKFTLDQSIRFLPSDRILPHAYSPLQDRYPAANVDVPLHELLRRVIGGPAPVDHYIASLGITGFHLEDNENTLHHNVAAQYRNWFEPAGAVQLLRRIADHSPLTSQHTQFLLHWMQPSGLTARLQADLPSGTLVAHKSGTSDVDNGLAHATNDIGLITLPDGRQLAIAVFITDSTAGQSARENAIAQIARAAYDAGLRTPK
jgi:beta-lactamase class A